MDLNSIYTELIMEHNSSKHNKGALENPSISERGHNPSCGDDITLEVQIENGIIKDASYTGVGCAISQASTSMMIDLIKGKSTEEALDLVEIFMDMIKKNVDDEEELEKLEDAIVLQNISNMPARVKCAVLAWHTLKEAISKQ
ncbi:MAG TPA: SUF system NifU family Fe-S cluster assembly protein [Tissierellaceae bacterium]|nr:SUF system NifU family Fe-S cluster assembly protein [Tissierellaceae bacterium]